MSVISYNYDLARFAAGLTTSTLSLIVGVNRLDINIIEREISVIIYRV